MLGDRSDPQLWRTEASGALPRAAITWQRSFADCKGGWRLGKGSFGIKARQGGSDAEHIAFPGLARGAAGELLVQHHVRRGNHSGLQFFGSPVRWYSYAYTDWRRVPAAPADAIPVPLTAADLPAVPDLASRMRLDYVRERQAHAFQSWLRTNLPPDTTITILRERQFDPAALALGADQVRFELAGHWPPDGADPFTPLLERHAAIGPIQVKQSRRQPDNRHYLLLEFTLTVQAAAN